LTQEQYLIIQHYLPKKYALIDHKHIKKGVVVPSALKLGPEDVKHSQLRHKIYLGSQGISRIQKRYKAARKESELRKMTSTLRRNRKSLESNK